MTSLIHVASAQHEAKHTLFLVLWIPRSVRLGLVFVGAVVIRDPAPVKPCGHDPILV